MKLDDGRYDPNNPDRYKIVEYYTNKMSTVNDNWNRQLNIQMMGSIAPYLKQKDANRAIDTIANLSSLSP